MKQLARDDRIGLITHIVSAVGLAVLGNIIIILAGWNRTDPQLKPSFAPPDYVVGFVWLFLFAFMGTARWLIITSRAKAALYHSRIVTFLIAFCFLYPFYTLGLKSSAGLIGNIATILIASWATFQIRSSSKTASALVFLIVLWVCFATAIVIESFSLAHKPLLN